MYAFFIFQKVKNILKKENITVKKFVYLNLVEKRLIVDNIPISLQVVDLQSITNSYQQVKNVKEVLLTPTKITIEFKDGKRWVV